PAECASPTFARRTLAIRHLTALSQLPRTGTLGHPEKSTQRRRGRRQAAHGCFMTALTVLTTGHREPPRVLLGAAETPTTTCGTASGSEFAPICCGPACWRQLRKESVDDGPAPEHRVRREAAMVHEIAVTGGSGGTRAAMEDLDALAVELLRIADELAGVLM